MTEFIDVIWSAHSEGIYAAVRHITILPPWAGLAVNAETVAQEVCEDFFDSYVWRKLIHAPDFAVTVEIHSPPEVAGTYEVTMERVTKAKARKQPTTEGNRDATRP